MTAPKYRPRRIGYRAPLGKEAFEFAIYGDDVPGSIVRLTDLFLEHKARLLNHRLDWNDVEKRFAAFYMVDMAEADCASSKLAEILRARAGVDEVRVISRGWRDIRVLHVSDRPQRCKQGCHSQGRKLGSGGGRSNQMDGERRGVDNVQRRGDIWHFDLSPLCRES